MTHYCVLRCLLFLCFFLSAFTAAIEDESCFTEGTCLDSACADESDDCLEKAEKGECSSNLEYMRENCRQSCELCKGIPKLPENSACVDSHPKCRKWRAGGQCTARPKIMMKKCRKSCQQCINVNKLRAEGKSEEQIIKLYRFIKGNWGKTQYLGDDDDEKADYKPWFDKMNEYAMNNVTLFPLAQRIQCQNKRVDCIELASSGECHHGVPNMMRDCPLACRMCHILPRYQRCRREQSAVGWMKEKGWIDSTFRELLKRNDVELASKKVPFQEDDDPWILRVDNFLTADECDALLQTRLEWEDSPALSAGGDFEESVKVWRTSQSAYCNTTNNEWDGSSSFSCDPINSVKQKIQSLLSIPSSSIEPIEFVRYGPHQSAGLHDDMPVHDEWMAAGPRALSFVVSLVEDGVSLGFPDLEWTSIRPAKGQLLIWPNVWSLDVTKGRDDMQHEILPSSGQENTGVILLQTWARLFDYEAAKIRDCV